MGMNLFFYLIIFLFGLAVGSFLNCVIYRLEIGDSFLKGRSYCPHCKHILSWQDLIPVLSFFILRGKCRYCQKPISLQYPLVELSAGILFVSFFIFHFSPKESLWLPTGQAFFNQFSISNFQLFNLCYLLIVFCFLIIIFVYDLKNYIIPDEIIYSVIIITFIYNIFYSLFVINNSQFLTESLFSAFGAAAFFLFIVLISRGRWMGVGDIKLAFFMGLFLGWPNILVALFLAFFLGAIIGIGLIMLKKKTLKSEVPFGPFLITGIFIALFFGQNLINWYLNFI